MNKESATKDLLSELKENGFKYKNIDELLKKDILKLGEVYVILKWLPEIYKEHLGTGVVLVQSLKVSEDFFDAKSLIELFEESDLNGSVKSGIGFVLSSAKTNDISEWVKTQLINMPYSFERSALVSALVLKGGFENKRILKNFLESIFDKYPISVLELYDKIGENSDIDFLLDKLKLSDKKIGKEIEKTLKKILKKEKSRKN